ncbi:MAG: T9SS type A sorting domain-containing protein [Bacteroidaceae bacterium]|nr:T9SS type A sorting domain-containing protein [Bacteroidaceae bacterium]
MKKTLLSVLMLLASAFAWAEDQYLCIWQADGQTVDIALDDEPVTTFSNGNLVISTRRTTITYPLQMVKRYTFEAAPTGIQSATANMHISTDGSCITFSAFDRDTNIAVYNLAGVRVRTVLAKAGTGTVVSVASLPKGTYIVKVNDITFKLLSR